jgi:hypothetical protein
MLMTIFLASLLTSVAALQAAPTPPPAEPGPSIIGLWSLGETRNCERGPAWLFHADGYYVEVTLPDQGPSAVGRWVDEGGAIAYTHSHVPFSDGTAPNEMRRLVVVERTADLLSTRNYRGVSRIFHRCPVTALRALAGQAAH